MSLKHLFTAQLGDGSGDVVMAIQGDPMVVARAVQDMSSVRSVTSKGNVSDVVFKGRVDHPMGMFAIIKARAKNS
jgi:hypothetical protein